MLKLFQKLAEDKIQEAVERGEFNNLKNAGQQINYQEYVALPASLRMMHKLLKDANCLPPEVEMMKQITGIKEVLAKPDLKPADRVKYTKLLRTKETEFELRMAAFRKANE